MTTTVATPTTAGATAAATKTTWSIDPRHSTAEFAVKHMMVSTVKGSFKVLEGVVDLDEEDPRNSSVSAVLATDSVYTGVEDRDAHLRSDDFFNAEKYPRITFQSTAVEKLDDQKWRVAGILTIRDITKAVTIDTEFEGMGPDAYGGYRVGFTAETRVNRRDFGLNWNSLIETGGVAVGDQVKITLHVEAIRTN